MWKLGKMAEFCTGKSRVQKFFLKIDAHLKKVSLYVAPNSVCLFICGLRYFPRLAAAAQNDPPGDKNFDTVRNF